MEGGFRVRCLPVRWRETWCYVAPDGEIFLWSLEAILVYRVLFPHFPMSI